MYYVFTFKLFRLIVRLTLRKQRISHFFAKSINVKFVYDETNNVLEKNMKRAHCPDYQDMNMSEGKGG